MTPLRAAVRLDLIDSVVFSERAASTGAHRSLDYIPGAALLGAMAGRLYGELERQGVAFDAFHSGKLRFGNGLPLHLLRNGRGGLPSWPLPLSLHRPKGKETTQDKLASWIENRVLPDGDGPGDHAQWQREAKAYVTAEHDVVQPPLVYVMRTAIDGITGRAREQQLFGYEALAQGQSFLASIEADAEAADTYYAVLTDLRERSVLRLGRSRGTEYGRVAATVLDRAPPEPPPRVDEDGTVRLWALSELCLMDKFGRPADEISGEALGIEGATIDWRRTFIRTRRYAPFNAQWGYRGLERVVIHQGSVITLSGVDAAAVRQALAAGVGQFRETGLGRIAVNPRILVDGHPAETTGDPVPMPQPAEARQATESDFIGWLRRKSKKTNAASTRAQCISDALNEIETLYEEAAKWNAIESCGPGPAQWNAVRGAAERASGAENLKERLFDGDKGIAKEKDDVWGTRYGIGDGSNAATFHGWLLQLVDTLSKDRDGLDQVLPEIAKQAAELVRRRLQPAVRRMQS